MSNVGWKIVQAIIYMRCICRAMSGGRMDTMHDLQIMVEPRVSLSFLRNLRRSSRTRTSRSTVTCQEGVVVFGERSRQGSDLV